jgi:DNA-binding GntR family transcriptional regulator
MNKYTYTQPCTKEQLELSYCKDRLSQNECASKFGVSQKRIFTAMKRFGIKARVAAKRNQNGSQNDSWKGDGAGRQAFHRRLYSLYGKPKMCAVCGTTEKHRSYDYANLSGNYHDINDYKPMCRSCHWKYDKKIGNIKHMNQKMKGGNHA